MFMTITKASTFFKKNGKIVLKQLLLLVLAFVANGAAASLNSTFFDFRVLYTITKQLKYE